MKSPVYASNKELLLIKEAFETEEAFKKRSLHQQVALKKDYELIEEIIYRLKRESFVIESYPDRSKYYGQKSEDKQERQGIGEYYYESGAVYRGEWLSGIRSGLDQYDGRWKMGMRNGPGLFFYKKSGDLYEGEFADDNREGFGTYVFGTGGYYEGEWLQNKRVGKGIMKFSDGSKYIGEWKRNKRDGSGVFFSLDAKGNEVVEYCGEWQNNKRNGVGIVKEDSDILITLWENDVLIEVLEIELFVLKKALNWSLETRAFSDCIVKTFE